MSAPYEHLAEWFEHLNADCDYPKWSQYFLNALQRYGTGTRGLDLGCGSGAFTRALAKAGYTMTGADISPAMLGKAMRLAREEGLSIPFVQMDAARASACSPYDFLLSANDCVNYLPQKSLLRAFKSWASCLKTGGLLLFDVSSPCKLRGKVANNTFWDDEEDVSYFEFNTLFQDRVETEITLFIREGELFRRADEKHVRYIHEEEDILTALHASGFEVLAVEGKLGEDKEGSERLNFQCRKARS